MGSRAQIHIDDTDVYLYTHWGSETLPKLLANVLADGKRLDDPEYLTRIIFEAMVEDASYSKETGFGIGTQAHTDLDYPPIRVSCENQTVVSEHGLQTFKEFINMEMK